MGPEKVNVGDTFAKISRDVQVPTQCLKFYTRKLHQDHTVSTTDKTKSTSKSVWSRIVGHWPCQYAGGWKWTSNYREMG